MQYPFGILAFIRTTLIVITAAVLANCAQNPDKPTLSEAASGEYNANSWQTIISDTCRVYFDGCNNCTRNMNNGIAACGRKACFQYQEPKCLEDPYATSNEPKVAQFSCSGRKSFRVFYVEYTAGDQKLRLKNGQAMFVDGQTHIAEVMTRQPSASGEKFVSGDLTFWSKESEAMVNKAGAPLYTDCKAE